ncbi:class II aldolase/adducin family protein [Devosia sp. SD17-2]|uniref:class II aldolase/adducin family protein n=1 Tax=Devosia sp. SD17-2 TaxID=2976459 RepID=UPI0023D7EE8E|nr:class II aldolase/adducin family protein [Devosia sp. SD17-2]WEJ32037.1 class II aldolase/adducin family protein [Devosia sp. SD17-2]
MAADQQSTQALAALSAFSARLGRDITRTQGAGGNTSIKIGDVMWVKASGTWLAHALERDIMVPLETAPLVEALDAGDPRAEKATDFVVADLNVSGLRPSIEASVHASIPQRVVAHFHCVNTLAHAVCTDAEDELTQIFADRLPHLSWALIPYRRPGTPLARAIAAVRDRAPDVLVLANHGLVVCGDTVEETAARVEEVTAALALPRRTTALADFSRLQAEAETLGDYALPDDKECHDIALDPIALTHARGGSLYPDHVIFLGTELGTLDEPGNLAATVSAEEPKLVVLPGQGVLVRKGLTAGGQAMVRCLAEVVTRIPEGRRLNYLTADQEYELTHWEAEKYRQSLDRQATQG